MVAGASAAGPTVYLSPSGSDSAACTQAAPCKTFDRGYRVAAPGAEVELAGGTYAGQSMNNLPVKSSSEKVVFQPAAGATVVTSNLGFVNSQNIEVRDVKTGGWQFQNGAAHITLRRVVAGDVTATAGYFSGSDDIQVIDSEIARVDPNDGIHMNNGGGPNTNIVIDGLFMHDLTINNDTTSHDDCIQTGDVTNLTIRNSRFQNCGTQGVFLNPYNGGSTKNVLIENNFFGIAQLGYNILYVGDAVGVTVRNNSFIGSVYSYQPASFTHLKMYNNIFAENDSYNCGVLASRSEVFSNNASRTSCSGATNHLVNANIASQFVNPGSNSATFDLHLKAGAAAIDKGTSASFGATDYDAQGRPMGGAVDIGADEYDSGGSPPPPPPADTTAPTTSISSAPSGSTVATSASLSFTGADETTATGSLTFECKLDAGAYAACTSPKAYSGLAVGSHTFSVRAKDAAGNVDATPATATWTVAAPADTTAPTTISSGTSGSTTATTASFSFTGADDTTATGSLTYECSFDGAVFLACTSPKSYSGLAVGNHTFAVRAKDAAGNVDQSPASSSWTVTAVTPPADSTAPTTSISSAPSGSTTATTASFAFAGADDTTAAGSLTFECKLDAGAYAACTSPRSYNSVAVGSHTFSVRAKDAAGNVDPSPATASWTVTAPPPADTTAPDTTIASKPANPTTETAASFTFSGTDDTTAAGALTFQCSVDGAVYATCSSPKAYTGLAVGAHDLRVRARDAAGNVDASPAAYGWTIAAPDTTAPETAITDGPPATTLSTSAQFAFKASDAVSPEAAVAFECSLDGGPWGTCTSPATYTGLGLLAHTFAVRATDEAGNVDGSPATAAWTVLGVTLPPVGLPPVTPGDGGTAPTDPSIPSVASEPEVPPVLSSTHVVLTAPTAGATFTRSLVLAATASAGTGATVKRVEFWMDGTRIERDTSAPYKATWSAPSRLATGTHTLSARVYDTAGRVASTAVTVTKAASTRAASARTATVAELSGTEQGGGTYLAGASRASATVVASLVPCSGVAPKKTKVRLKAVGGQLSGHRDGRLCVVGLAPAA
jgi:hypothetical protein